jgi:hypothetical protein
MAERREHLRFALEARHPELVVGEDIAEDLQRDVASELGIARAVHLAHAPRAEGGDDLANADSRERSATCGRSPRARHST